MTSSTKKKWADGYEPITRVTSRSQSGQAAFESAFLELDSDDDFRFREPAYPPNYRNWPLETEEDVAAWFNAEISNIVLPAWGRTPDLLQQSRAKPLAEKTINITADVVYYFKRLGATRVPVAIGEFKRNLIDPSWETGRPSDSQMSLSRELRG